MTRKRDGETSGDLDFHFELADEASGSGDAEGDEDEDEGDEDEDEDEDEEDGAPPAAAKLELDWGERASVAAPSHASERSDGLFDVSLLPHHEVEGAKRPAAPRQQTQPAPPADPLEELKHGPPSLALEVARILGAPVGRAARWEVWMIPVLWGATVVAHVALRSESGGLGYALTWFVTLLVTWCTAAVAMRRLHDLGRSGEWALGLLIPGVNLGILTWLMSWPGEEGPTEYGPEPTHKGSWAPFAIAALMVGVAAVTVRGAQSIPARAASETGTAPEQVTAGGTDGDSMDASDGTGSAAAATPEDAAPVRVADPSRCADFHAALDDNLDALREARTAALKGKRRAAIRNIVDASERAASLSVDDVLFERPLRDHRRRVTAAAENVAETLRGGPESVHKWVAALAQIEFLTHQDFTKLHAMGVCAVTPAHEERAARAAPLLGVVIGPDGKVVADAEVCLSDFSAGPTPPCARSDADGMFALDPVTVWAERIVVATLEMDAGLVSARAELSAGMEPTTMALKLRRARGPDDQIAGRIVDRKGEAVVGAQICAERRASGGRKGKGKSRVEPVVEGCTKSAGDGAFTLTAEPGSRRTLRATFHEDSPDGPVLTAVGTKKGVRAGASGLRVVLRPSTPKDVLGDE